MTSDHVCVAQHNGSNIQQYTFNGQLITTHHLQITTITLTQIEVHSQDMTLEFMITLVALSVADVACSATSLSPTAALIVLLY